MISASHQLQNNTTSHVSLPEEVQLPKLLPEESSTHQVEQVQEALLFSPKDTVITLKWQDGPSLPLLSKGDGTYEVLEDTEIKIGRSESAPSAIMGTVVGPGDLLRAGNTEVTVPWEPGKAEETTKEQGVSSHYLPLRKGSGGRLRSEDELSVAEVANVLHDQLSPIHPLEIEAMLRAYGPEAGTARTVLVESSQFGSLQSLKGVRTELERFTSQGWRVYLDGEGTSLSDPLIYLNDRKKNFMSVASRDEVLTTYQVSAYATDKIEDNTAIILDAVVLEKLKKDETFAQSVLEHKVALLYPRGLETGIGAFSCPTLPDMEHKLLSLVEAVKEVRSDESVSEATKAVLERDVRKGLREIEKRYNFPQGSMSSKLHSFSSSLEATATPDSDTLATMVNGTLGVNFGQLKSLAANYPKEDGPLINELLVQHTRLFSHRTLAAAARETHARILSTFPTTHEDDIYYVVPKREKSYGLITTIYRLANDVASDHILSLDKASSVTNKKALFVILDDIAGSGVSLGGSLDEVRERVGEGRRIVVAPVLSTEKAAHYFRGKESDDPELTYLPHSEVSTYKTLDLFQNAPDAAQKKRVWKILEKLGFDSNGLFVAFPHMSPDNNSLFFIKHLACNFVMQGVRGLSVKER